MVTKLNTGFPLPSWKQGYARSADVAMFPSLWRGKMFQCVPSLGPTGATIRDISGYGNNGVLIGDTPIAWVVENLGHAFDLGVTPNDYIDFGSAASLSNPGGRLSLVFWFSLDSSGTTQNLMGKAESEDEYFIAWSGTGDGRLYGSVFDQSVPAEIGRWGDAQGVLDDGLAHCGIMTFNGGTTQAAIRLYLDGVRIDGNDTGSGTFVAMEKTTSPFLIGQAAEWSAVKMNGRFFSATIYNRALLLPEIRLLSSIPNADLILADADIGAVIAAAGGIAVLRRRYEGY